MKKVVFAATGASGAGLFLKLINAAKDSCEAHVIVSKNAMKVLETEENLKLNLDEIYGENCGLCELFKASFKHYQIIRAGDFKSGIFKAKF